MANFIKGRPLTSIDQQLFQTVLEAHKRSFSVQSDYARSTAELVGMAASLGLISTKVHNNIFSRDWRPTAKGLHWLESQNVDISEEDYDDAPIEHDAT
jgi:hypothetical protein